MNIYVGNLSFDATQPDLESLFSTHGKIDDVRLITDRYSGRSKGFGFVEMPNDDEAESAIQALNGADFQGRSLTVNEARPRESTGGGGGRRAGGGGGGGGGGGRW